jgi:hypothetical protein
VKILNYFKKKKQGTRENAYSKLGSLGISPEYMQMYQDSINKLKENRK